MEGKPPVCSIVMPVHNTPEPFLREAIESILGQTLRDFEFLIVDDGSDEYVRAIIETYKDGRIRYQRLETQSGTAEARNRALNTAQGEYIAFMDSDDISLPERLQKQVDYLQAHPAVGCLGTAYRFIRGSRLSAVPELPKEHAAIVSYLLFCGCVYCQSSVMLRRSTLEANSLRYRSEYVPAEDGALWFDLVGKTQFAMLQEVLVHYRQHEQSVSSCKYRAQAQLLATAQQQALERFGNFKFDTEDIWQRFLAGSTLLPREYTELYVRIEQVLNTLCGVCGYAQEAVLPSLRTRLRKSLYHTRSIKGQWELLCSPLRRRVHLPLWWCFYSFVTRGIL